MVERRRDLSHAIMVAGTAYEGDNPVYEVFETKPEDIDPRLVQKFNTPDGKIRYLVKVAKGVPFRRVGYEH